MDRKRSNLGLRLVVGLLLAVVAVGLIWLGGLPFTLFVSLGGLLILQEWLGLQQATRLLQVIGLLLLAVVFAVAAIPEISLAGLVEGGPAIALLALLGALLPVFLLSRFSLLKTVGLLYAGLPVLALLQLRAGADGLGLVLFAMAVVWATDTCAYFSGRAIGGPKIWPRISPSKTWAGLGGGMLGAGVVALALGQAFHLGGTPLALFVAGLLLAVVAQAGDFLESALKRHVGAKDSGHLLPGHGGIMDRVDGLVPVVLLVTLVVAFR